MEVPYSTVPGIEWPKDQVEGMAQVNIKTGQIHM